MEAHVVYLNFDAEGEMVYDPGNRADATENRHDIDRNLSGMLEGYGRGSARADVLDMVQRDFTDYGVRVTDVRPESVDYSMVVFTPNPGLDPTAVGAGAPDCNNAVPNSVSFVYLTSTDATTPQYQANLVSRTIAMSIGLELVVDEWDLMSEALGSDDRWFYNSCREIAADPPACPTQHESFCDDGTEQDAHRELELVFGWIGNY